MKFPCHMRPVILAASLLLSLSSSAGHAETLSLAGRWRFELDRANAGIQEKWFSRALIGEVSLPGSLPAQGIGDDVSVDTKWTGDIVDRSWFTAPQYEKYRQPGNLKVPFWLQPDKYYAGAAWYQRDIEIPASWAGKRVVLTLERPHWETRVWVDGQYLGSNDSLSTPHVYDLGTGLAPGHRRLTIRVDNSLVVDVGVNSHSVSDHTQGNWNGIVGEVSLGATPPVWLEDVQLYPVSTNGRVRAVVSLGNRSGQEGEDKLTVLYNHCAIDRPNKQAAVAAGLPQLLAEFPVRWSTTGTTAEVEFALPQAKNGLWDEFAPNLHPLVFQLSTGDSRSIAFGVRELATQGTQFVLNGRKMFFRGTLECCIFPKTGHPPTDVDSWKRIIRIAKAHGLNLIRFHSWCLPEAAFTAADELGFYYQVEIASWANQSTTLGDGKPVDDWLYREAARILKAYGNHPSFLLMPYGNEPKGRNSNAYLAKWVEHWKETDPRRLYTSGSGWPELAKNQFHVVPGPRIQAWGGGLRTGINALPPETMKDYRNFIERRSVPVISHEIGQWCVYPNFDEIPKYTGYLKPKNFEIFRDSLVEHGMGGLARKFLLASGKLQTLCYKEEIEAALRTPGMGGFELLDLHDFPGQGTALVGVLDPFWEDKGYVTAAEFSRFCNSTVPLARLKKRVFTTADVLEADVEVAHFGPEPIPHAAVSWKLLGENKRVVARGDLPAQTIPVDNGVALGTVTLALSHVRAPARYNLAVAVAPPSGLSKRSSSRFENDWDIWVYPAKPDLRVPAGILMTNRFDDEAVKLLARGGKVLLTFPGTCIQGDKRGKVALGFSSIFWNTAWTGRQPPHTLGILCDPKNPALADFPTEYHSDWQWWYLIHDAGAMILDGLPRELRPTVQVVDDWFTNRKLGLVLEARVGAGKLMLCSFDLLDELDENPVAAQMRHSLLRYMAGGKFKPAVELAPGQIRSLLRDLSGMQKYGAQVVKTDRVEPGFEGGNAIDNDAATLWHTSWNPSATGFPHEMEIQLQKPVRIRGFTALPRQDGNPVGWVKGYEIYASLDDRNWGEPVAKGEFPETADLKRIMLAAPVEACFIKFVALSAYGGRSYISLAEFDLVE